MKKKRMTKTNQIVIGMLLILLSTLVGIIIFYTQATSPYTKVRTDAIRIAQSKTAIKAVTNFDITTTTTTTYSLIGKNAKGETIGVLMPKSGGEIRVVLLADNQSNQSIKTAKLTLYKGKVVWQTKEKALYAFDTGEQLKA